MIGSRAAVTRRVAALATVLALLGPASARADDVADEADVAFQLGAEAYGKGDFRNALSHFLASNRLAPNKNAAFNAARCYEQLKQYPDAYRYYQVALDGEPEGAGRTPLREAMSRVAPFVAVVRVTTNPPGATLYVDRKDLGARGQTPRTLALAPGKYRFIAEREGWEPTTSAEIEVKAGTDTPLSLSLVQIVGTVEVADAPPGAEVLVDSATTPACTAPCRVTVAAGRHVLHVTRDGFVPIETTVDVTPREVVTVHARLSPRTGSVVVRADQRDARVEVDGRTVGFAPTVATVPVGKHQVRVSLPGHRTIAREVEVRANEESQLDLVLAPSQEVSAVSRTTESVDDAPSSVTIISSRELRAMQYPTIAEAIRGVRGMYVTDDRSYTFVGARGFSRTIDYGNKVLVLLDGHPLNDDVLGQSYTGFEGRTDLDDIERIEIVRGPGSALYGTGAFSAVINLVTRERGKPTFGEVGVSAVDYGVGRARATANVKLGEKTGFWASASAGRGTGRDLYFPERAGDTGALAGNARGVDGFDVRTTGGRLWHGDLTVQWMLTSRKKHLPSSEYDTIFGDPRLTFEDTRGLVEARYEPKLTDSVQSLSRAHVDMYDFSGVQPYLDADGGLAHEEYRGRWFGIEQRFLYSPSDRLRVTVGGSLQRHVTVTMTGKQDISGTYLDTSTPYGVAAGYAVADVALGDRARASGGVRVDSFSTFGASVNPRGALILKPYDGGVLKLMAGKAFRAPSPYELHYQSLTQAPSPGLRPEQVLSGEVELTHHFTPLTSVVVAAFSNYVTDLVTSRGTGSPTDPTHLVNSTEPVLALGGEIEARREMQGGWMLAASASVQRLIYLHNDEQLRNVPNSPFILGAVKAAIPLIGRSLSAMTRLSIEGPRWDRNELPTDPAQGHTSGAAVWDFVLSGEAEGYGVFYALGVYNAFDASYSAPVSSEYRHITIPQNGRTALLSTSVRF